MNILQANILVSPSGRACLGDFGLSTLQNAENVRWTSLSVIGSTGGTVRWQAPELCKGGTTVTMASDIFAFACVCYEVCPPFSSSQCRQYVLIIHACLNQIYSGRLPFYQVRIDMQVAFKIIMGGRPSRPSDSVALKTGLTDTMWGIMEDCWKQDPDDRPAAFLVTTRLLLESTASMDLRDAVCWDELTTQFASGVPEESALDSTVILDHILSS